MEESHDNADSEVIMAAIGEPLKVEFTADDSQIQEVMARVGKTTETMGKQMSRSSEVARLGFWTLGESAENFAQSLGVPHKMSRQLGNAIEDLSARMGTAAIAFGVIGLAATAAYSIWQHFVNEKKKAVEQTEKMTQKLLEEQLQLYPTTQKTQELRKAEEDLHNIKKRILDLKWNDYIINQQEEINKLKQQLTETIPWYQRLYMMIRGLAQPEQVMSEEISKRRKEIQNEIDLKEAELRQKRAQRNQAEINELMALNEAEKKRYYDYDEIMRQETQKDQEESIKRIMQARIEQQQRQQAYLAIASNFAQTFQMMASLGGKHARKWFSMYKMAAISEAIISTHAGAARALKDYPSPISYAVAAAIIANGLARVAVIRAQTFEGGGGGGAVGTYPANPATGLPVGPSESGGIPAQINIYVNGQVQSTYELAQGVVRELYRNNGEIGGYSIQVERSA